MSKVGSICVYCGSGAGVDPAYKAAAETLGRSMAEADIRLVYGGGSVGLMGITARAVIEAGGQVTGIIPRFLSDREEKMVGLDEMIVTEDMHERKQMMFARADAFVALPGGVGTLEELVEQLTWAQLGRHRKPILLANIGGFWDPLAVLLGHMSEQGFIRPGLEVVYEIAEAAEAIVPTLVAAAERIEAAAGDAETIGRM